MWDIRTNGFTARRSWSQVVRDIADPRKVARFLTKWSQSNWAGARGYGDVEWDGKLRLRGDSLRIYRVLRVLFLPFTDSLINLESIFPYKRSDAVFFYVLMLNVSLKLSPELIFYSSPLGEGKEYFMCPSSLNSLEMLSAFTTNFSPSCIVVTFVLFRYINSYQRNIHITRALLLSLCIISYTLSQRLSYTNSWNCIWGYRLGGIARLRGIRTVWIALTPPSGTHVDTHVYAPSGVDIRAALFVDASYRRWPTCERHCG